MSQGDGLNTSRDSYRSEQEISTSPSQNRERLPLVEQARAEIEIALNADPDMHSSSFDHAVRELALLNSMIPGVLTRAIASDIYYEKGLGRSLGEYPLWLDISPAPGTFNGEVIVTPTGNNWLDTLDRSVRESVELVSGNEAARRRSANDKFFDAEKPHLVDARIAEDGSLTLEVDSARYVANASISKRMCNALRALTAHGLVRRTPGEIRESDEPFIRDVIHLLGALGVREVQSGIDFSHPGNPFPQTLGISVMAVTNDGYLCTAVQGLSNITSKGHTTAFSSGSVNFPAGKKNMVEEAVRELGEEISSTLQLKAIDFLGLVRMADQGGKPELFYLAQLNHSAAQIQALSDSARSNSGETPELATKFGQPFFLGSTVVNQIGPNYPLRGGPDDEVRLKNIAFHDDTNKLLGCGIALLLKQRGIILA